MKQYLELLKDVRTNGIYKDDRTGTGTYSVCGRQLRFDLSKGFPAVTTKKLFFKGVVAELLWFLKGETNIKFLHEQGVHIWDEWAGESGDLGPVYGYQHRNWNGEGLDQVKNVIEQIKNNPNSRRHVVSAWNVSQLDQMALVPCHLMYMFYVAEGKLSCQFIMRSTDVFLGLPFNIASYALLTYLIAQVCDLEVGDLIFTGNDVHIYANHLDQVDLQLSRESLPLAQLWLNPDIKDIDDFKMSDIKLIGYNSHGTIKAPIAV